jgi:two-component system NtrC family sensor kinase
MGINHSGQQQSIPVARRLATPDGHFHGVLVAEIEPGYFARFYDGLELGPHATINLYQENGRTLLASTAKSTAPGDRLRPADTAPGASLGDGTSTDQFGRFTQEKMVAYHRTEGYPLIVSVGIDARDLRARWWKVAGPAIGAALAIVGLIIGFAVLIDRRSEERAQAQQRAMIMQKLEAMGQMTASVSHDFRNLLTVMTATLRLLRKHGPDEKVFSAAEEAIERGNKLIAQLLAFSRRQDLHVAPADINAFLSGLEDVLRHAAGVKVDLRFDLASDLPLCRTDQSQFDAALMNLVVNARQAIASRGSITITTRLAQRPSTATTDFVVLSVADTGSGIDESTLKRVFEPFFTTKAESGTGLGLAQVYGFMRQIGGDVEVESVMGVGTTFRLFFPVVAAGSTPAVQKNVEVHNDSVVASS